MALILLKMKQSCLLINKNLLFFGAIVTIGCNSCFFYFKSQKYSTICVIVFYEQSFFKNKLDAAVFAAKSLKAVNVDGLKYAKCCKIALASFCLHSGALTNKQEEVIHFTR